MTTLPKEPWDTAEPIAGASTPAPPHVRKLIQHTFSGKVGREDMAYMAKAILQMADEIFELRREIQILKKRL